MCRGCYQIYWHLKFKILWGKALLVISKLNCVIVVRPVWPCNYRYLSTLQQLTRIKWLKPKCNKLISTKFIVDKVNRPSHHILPSLLTHIHQGSKRLDSDFSFNRVLTAFKHFSRTSLVSADCNIVLIYWNPFKIRQGDLHGSLKNCRSVFHTYFQALNSIQIFSSIDDW